MATRRFVIAIILGTGALLACVWMARAECTGDACQPEHDPTELQLSVRPGDCKWGRVQDYVGPWNQQNCGYGYTYLWRILEQTVFDIWHDPDCVDTQTGLTCQPCAVLPFERLQCPMPITWTRNVEHVLLDPQGRVKYQHTWTVAYRQGCACAMHGCTD